jgi:hypothetical protein
MYHAVCDVARAQYWHPRPRRWRRFPSMHGSILVVAVVHVVVFGWHRRRRRRRARIGRHGFRRCAIGWHGRHHRRALLHGIIVVSVVVVAVDRKKKI